MSGCCRRPLDATASPPLGATVRKLFPTLLNQGIVDIKGLISPVALRHHTQEPLTRPYTACTDNQCTVGYGMDFGHPRQHERPRGNCTVRSNHDTVAARDANHQRQRPSSSNALNMLLTRISGNRS